ncbi:MAG TPA: hypothetical protein VFQ36_09305 [Ktedonobacteraceae bacterium]|nr:hypothetical protein [Ktedonobacteraceae bacterium]
MLEVHTSEITRFREQQALEEEAARLALSGYAITARHDFINARMQRGGERILRLIEQGKHEEAQALMNSENWGVGEAVTAKGKEKGRKKQSHA